MFCSTISRSLWPIRCICSVSGTAACLSGGLIGVIVVMIIFARRTKRSFFGSLILSHHSFRFGLGAGRLGNFINGGVGPR